VTIAEVVVAALLLVVVLGIVHSVWLHATRAVTLTMAHEDALRSAHMALEAIRVDVSRLLVQNPREDLAILPGPDGRPGRGLCVRVPADARSGDPWRTDLVPVSFALEPIGGGRGGGRSHHLSRTDAGGRTERIRGCVIRDLIVRYVTPDSLETGQSRAFIEVSVIGLDSPGGSTAHAASVLIPMNVVSAPEPYRFSYDGSVVRSKTN
jgi:hypothetical protein